MQKHTRRFLAFLVFVALFSATPTQAATVYRLFLNGVAATNGAGDFTDYNTIAECQSYLNEAGTNSGLTCVAVQNSITCSSIGGTCTGSCLPEYRISGATDCGGFSGYCCNNVATPTTGAGTCTGNTSGVSGVCQATCSSGKSADSTCTAASGAAYAGQNCCVASAALPTSGGAAAGEGAASEAGTAGTFTNLNYTPLERIPGTGTNSGLLADYIQAIYKFALWAVGIAAMFMLAVGGMMYLTSAGNTSQTNSAKKVIFDALIGLTLAIVAWLILYVINPDLVRVSLNFGAAKINATTAGASTGSGTTGGTAGVGSVGSGSCGGMGTQTGIDKQCGDASSALSTLLTCINGKVPGAVLSSISDSSGFTECKTNWSKPKCAHAQTSCHYGGGASKTATECQQSQAADISVGGNINSQLSKDIQSAASACGGRINPEGSPAHVHVSTQTSCCTL